ncbi:MAG TPA: LolA-related protein, partial [Gammaproteobacteria bacterium]|nr:LolA-related protein [Gammaproteobacteria bacterium]
MVCDEHDKTPRAVVPAFAACAALAVAVASHAAPDSAALIARLAKPAPATVAFVEVRFSTLLVEPLVVGGTLVYEGDGA